MRAVVALGGNAIWPRGGRGTVTAQRASIREACDAIAAIEADEMVVTHGNGPQVGRMLLLDEAMPDDHPRFPLDVHVAETQGMLGYLITQELTAAFTRAGSARPVVTILTQVEVDPSDPGFVRATKPVGPFLSEKGAAEYRAHGIEIAEVPGGGWRRVVGSPEPISIVEIEAIRLLLDAGSVPVVAGGGGIAVVREGNGWRGAPSVIDKDLTASVLARAIRADLLLILTDVDRVRDGDGHELDHLSVTDARAGVESGVYPRGSMGEKVLAAASAAEAGVRAVIARLDAAADAARGRAGTTITAN